MSSAIRVPPFDALSDGVSGNAKGRPKRKGERLPYARNLDRIITIKVGLGARQVTS
jgi:hypothetical protein